MEVRRELRAVAVATSVGICVGVVVLGIASRLAMRAIAATSPRLKGQLTSDLEPIGEITLGGTIGLIFFVGVFGGSVLGLGYMALRWLFPSDLRWRAVCAAGLAWCIGAAVMFDAEDFDFRFLEPGWLSVLMFSAIFLAAGWVTAAGIEVAVRRWPTSGRRAWTSMSPLVLMIPFVPLLAALPALAMMRSAPVLHRVAATPAVVVVGRALLVAGALALGIPAVLEVVEIV